MLENENTFTIINEDGRETVCDVLFTFDSEETGRSYIAYTDNSRDENGNVQVFASVFNPDLEDQKLIPIETEEEWAVIEEILETLQDTIRARIEDAEKRPGCSAADLVQEMNDLFSGQDEDHEEK